MNLGELVGLIADDLIDERLTSGQIQNAINQAMRFYSRKTFYFNTIKVTTPTTPNQEYYSVFNIDKNVADMYSIQTVRYQNNEVSLALRPLSDASMENVSPISPDYNLPTYWAYAQMQIRLLPAPKDIAGQLTVIATYKYPNLSGSDDTNAFLTYADELIRHGAKRYIAYNTLHDAGLGDRCAAMEAEEFASLRTETLARDPIEPMRVSPDLFGLASNFAPYDVVLDQ